MCSRGARNGTESGSLRCLLFGRGLNDGMKDVCWCPARLVETVDYVVLNLPYLERDFGAFLVAGVSYLTHLTY
jgi:hypothetical protein